MVRAVHSEGKVQMLEVKTRLVAPALMALAGIALVGCSRIAGRTRVSAGADTVATAKFNLDPATWRCPYPIDLLLPGSTDGTLNLPTSPIAPARCRLGAQRARRLVHLGLALDRLHAAARSDLARRRHGEDRQAVSQPDQQGAGRRDGRCPGCRLPARGLAARTGSDRRRTDLRHRLHCERRRLTSTATASS